jgi:hypothetical protein
MPDTKITALTAISTVDPAVDVLPIVDVSDTTMAASGTTKKITSNQILGAGGTATLASATITGDLTVDTSTLKVDSTGNGVGIGAASPTANTLTIGASRFILCSDSQSKFGDSGIINGGAADANTQIQYFGGKALIFSEGASNTKMTLNSTGLGVGGSPTAKVSCAGFSSSNVAPDFQINRSSSGTGIQTGPNLTFSDGTTNNTVAIQSTQGRFGVWNYGAGAWNERLSVDASGNVGVGVVPSAWASVALQVGPYAGLHQNNSLGSAELTYNCYRSSGSTWNYIQTDTAARYRMWNSTHSWFIAPSGTAGNAITFTQAMVLDASGRLLVGKISGVNNIETVGAGVDGRGSVTGVSTVATTIYTIKQSSTAAMCVVFGDDGSNGFCDIVLFLATVAPKVVSSQTLYGSPAARTYTASTTNLQLAIASGTLTIRTAALSTLNS